MESKFFFNLKKLYGKLVSQGINRNISSSYE